MKQYAKHYFKKEIKREVKRIIRQKMEEYYNAGVEYIQHHREELIGILVNATGASRYELERLDDQELLDIAYAAVNLE